MNKFFTNFRIVFGIILLCVATFCFFEIVQYLKIGAAANVQTFSKPKKLYGNEICYQSNPYFYLVDETTGTIHIFNQNGKFLNGVQLPANSGAVWIGTGNNLCAYCVRKDLLVEITDAKNISQKDVYFSNPEEFYNSLNLTNKSISNIKGNVVHITNNINDEIVLEIESSSFPIKLYIILFLICMIGYLAVFMKIDIKRRFNKLYK